MLSFYTFFITSFIITLSGAMMPGPLLTVTIANSAKKGFWEGPLLVLGHGILELVLVIAIVLGMSSLFKSNTFLICVSVLGGGMLIYMGYDMLKNAKNLSLNPQKINTKKSVLDKSTIVTGAIVSAANPYWTLWWATIGLGYLLSATKFGILGVVTFFVGHILADLLWYAFVAFGISKGKKLMKDSLYQMIIKICGAILIIFGAYFLYGLQKFL